MLPSNMLLPTPIPLINVTFSTPQAIALMFRLLSINSRSARLSLNALKWRILGVLWRLLVNLRSLDVSTQPRRWPVAAVSCELAKSQEPANVPVQTSLLLLDMRQRS